MKPQRARPGSTGDVDGRLRQAAAAHGAGQLDEALAVYDTLIQRHPGDWRAHYLSGLLMQSRHDLPGAAQRLRRASTLNPAHVDGWVALADAESASGNARGAHDAAEEAVRRRPEDARVLFRRALAREALGEWEGAIADYERIVTLDPAFAEAWNNLGNVRRAVRRIDDARRAYERAIELRPEFAQAHHNLAVLLELELGAVQDALPHYRRAVELAPDYAEAHCHLGAALWQLGHALQAVECYERALALRPDYPEVWNNLGLVYARERQYPEAEACYRRALEINPAFFQVHNNLGFLQLRRERPDLAVAEFEAAAALVPDAPESLNGLGMALKELGRPDDAVAHLERAVALRPTLAPAWANLGEALAALGETERAEAALMEADRLEPNAGLRLRAALVLPPVMTGRDGIDDSRARMAAKLDALLASDLVTNDAGLLAHADTPFFLAYHGRSDRELLTELAAAAAQMAPQLLATAPHCLRYVGPGERIRVAVVSRFCYNHSVGNFFNPILARLAAEPDFEVTLFTVGMKTDAVLERFAAACHEHVQLDDSLEHARSTLTAGKFDLLIYPEIGMDAFTYFLAFARLAPVQCVLHGHSNTTGLPAMDYFVSSRLLEPDGGQDHYSEQLVLLDTLMMHLEPVQVPTLRLRREELGLETGVRLYVCPMKLQKLHPDMDGAFLGILERDPDARIVLFDDDRHTVWREQVLGRLRRSLGERMDRIVVRPWAPLAEFVSVLAAADAVLDSFHHGGATTANICLSCGIPMITWPGPTGRGRGLLAYYRLLGVEDCIAPTQDAFVNLATRCARNPEWRRGVADRIVGALPLLHDNDGVFRAYADAFRTMVGSATGLRECPGYGGRRYFGTYPLARLEDLEAGGQVRTRALDLARVATRVRPRYVGEEASPPEIEEAPAAGMVALTGAAVHGETAVITCGDRALVEMTEHPGFARFNYVSPAAPMLDRDRFVLHALRVHPQEIERGFWMGGLGSSNYFHWMIEFLPRLIGYAEHVPRDTPLILDERVAAVPQLMEALDTCLGGAVDVIRLPRNARCSVRELWLGTLTSWLPFDYREGQVIRADDRRLNDAALRWVRERMRTAASATTRKGRKLYLPRAGSTIRRLVNAAEVRGLLERNGFEPVFPEKLSLHAQIQAFAEADIVVAPSGAGMTNVLFASPGARVICFLPEEWRAFSAYSTLAHAAGAECRCVGGEVVADSFRIPHQRDYWVDMEQLQAALSWASR